MRSDGSHARSGKMASAWLHLSFSCLAMSSRSAGVAQRCKLHGVNPLASARLPAHVLLSVEIKQAILRQRLLFGISLPTEGAQVIQILCDAMARVAAYRQARNSCSEFAQLCVGMILGIARDCEHLQRWQRGSIFTARRDSRCEHLGMSK